MVKAECADRFTVSRLCAFYILLALLMLSEQLWANGLQHGEVKGDLGKRGESTYEYLGWIDVFSAELFDDPVRRGEPVLGPVPKRLVVRYHRDFTAKQFAAITRAGIARNVSGERLAQLEGRISEFNRLYLPVTRGDRYEIVYEPGQGTALHKNGTSLGTVEGDDFAEALFAVWLGRVPFDERVRAGLLGER